MRHSVLASVSVVVGTPKVCGHVYPAGQAWHPSACVRAPCATPYVPAGHAYLRPAAHQ